MYKRILAVIMAVILLAGSVNLSAFAQEDVQETVTTEEETTTEEDSLSMESSEDRGDTETDTGSGVLDGSTEIEDDDEEADEESGEDFSVEESESDEQGAVSGESENDDEGDKDFDGVDSKENETEDSTSEVDTETIIESETVIEETTLETITEEDTTEEQVEIVLDRMESVNLPDEFQGYTIFDSGTWCGLNWYALNPGAILLITGTMTKTHGSSTSPPWVQKNYVQQIHKIVVQADGVKSTHNWFVNAHSLEEVDFSKFDTSVLTNTTHMFWEAEMTSLDLTSFDVSNVTNMTGMFEGCRYLAELDVSNWDTSNVTNMESIFDNCGCYAENPQTFPIGNWNTSSVTNLKEAFRGCNSFNPEDIVNWDTSAVTNMYGTFAATDFTSLNLEGMETSAVTNMDYLFQNCTSLNELKVSTWNTSKVTSMYQTFNVCYQLETLDLSGWNTAKVTDMYGMFCNCDNLKSLTVGDGWSTANVTDMSDMFAMCQKLDDSVFDAILPKFNTAKVTKMTSMFSCCKSVESLDLSSFKTTSLKDTSHMFSGCSGLTILELPSTFSTSKVTNMSGMFASCSGLTALELPSTFSTSNVTEMSSMFSGCSGLTALELPSTFVTSKVTYMNEMFSGCSGLTKLDLSTFDTSSLILMNYMFNNCNALKSLDISSFNLTTMTSSAKYAFQDCCLLESVKIPLNCTVEIPLYGTFFDEGGAAYTALPLNATESFEITRTVYSISYVLNGGYNVNENSSYTYGVENLLPTPIKSYCEFAGWYTTADFSGEPVTTIGADETGEKIFYAKWVIKPTTYSYSYDCDKGGTQEINLKWLLPSDCENPQYEVTVPEEATYILSASIIDNKFVYVVGTTENGGESTTILLTITSDNYEPVVETFNITIKEKTKPIQKTGKEVQIVGNSTLVYGQPIKNLILNTDIATFVSEKSTSTVVDGTLSWKDETIIPEVGTTTAEWVFTPTNTTTYGKTTGSVAITVEKAVPTVVLPIAENTLYIENAALDTIELNGGSVTTVYNDEIVAIDGNWNWEKPSDIILLGNNTFSVVFVQTDTKNYEAVTGEVSFFTGLEGLWYTEIEDQSYTGKEIRPHIDVYYGFEKLTENIDYTLSYENNKAITEEASIIIVGKGNYSEIEEKITFKIVPRDITSNGMTICNNFYATYSGRVQKPLPIVRANGKKLKNNVDYVISYPSEEEGAYQKVGSYIIRISGVEENGYTGTKDIIFTITDKPLLSKAKIARIANQEYQNGAAIEPKVKVTYGGKTLTENTDYTVSYNDNKNVGIATVTIVGIGSYSGEKTAEFIITGRKMKNVDVEDILRGYEYTGQEIKPKATLTYSVSSTETVTLKEGIDYTVSYRNNVKKGKAFIIFTGKGMYTGTLRKTFRIEPYDIGKDTNKKITITCEEKVTFTKGGSVPTVVVKYGDTELKQNKDYSLYYRNKYRFSEEKKPTVSISGKGNFKGSLESITYEIDKCPLSEEDFSLTVQDVSFRKRSNNYKTKYRLKDANGKRLWENTDYTVAYYYENDGSKGDAIVANVTIPAGTTLIVEFTGIGHYTGTLSASYRIKENQNVMQLLGNFFGLTTDEDKEETISTENAGEEASVAVNETTVVVPEVQNKLRSVVGNTFVKSEDGKSNASDKKDMQMDSEKLGAEEVVNVTDEVVTAMDEATVIENNVATTKTETDKDSTVFTGVFNSINEMLENVIRLLKLKFSEFYK